MLTQALSSVVPMQIRSRHRATPDLHARARHRQPHALLLPFRTPARVRLRIPTSAAARPAVAPIVSAQRGPNTSAIWPTTGEPNGAPPRKAATRSAVTRPRTAASVEVCMKVLLALGTVIAEAPIGTSATANSQ